MYNKKVSIIEIVWNSNSKSAIILGMKKMKYFVDMDKLFKSIMIRYDIKTIQLIYIYFFLSYTKLENIVSRNFLF